MKKVKLKKEALESVGAQVAYELLGDEDTEPNEKLSALFESVEATVAALKVDVTRTVHAVRELQGEFKAAVEQALLKSLNSGALVDQIRGLRHELSLVRSEQGERLTTEAEIGIMRDRSERALARADEAERRAKDSYNKKAVAEEDKQRARAALLQLAVRAGVISSHALVLDSPPNQATYAVPDKEKKLVKDDAALVAALDARILQMADREKRWLARVEGDGGITQGGGEP